MSNALEGDQVTETKNCPGVDWDGPCYKSLITFGQDMMVTVAHSRRIRDGHLEGSRISPVNSVIDTNQTYFKTHLGI